MNIRKQKGFTLVELVVAIACMALTGVCVYAIVLIIQALQTYVESSG